MDTADRMPDNEPLRALAKSVGPAYVDVYCKHM